MAIVVKTECLNENINYLADLNFIYIEQLYGLGRRHVSRNVWGNWKI